MAVVGAGGFLAPAASADRHIAGCTIVDNPTPEHHTVCPEWRDTRGANLDFDDLRYADLRAANLHGKDLQFTNLSHADLYDADLERTYMYSTNLVGANLDDAHLSHAQLIHADLRDADLSHADLLGASLSRDVDLRGDTFCYTRMPDGVYNNSGCK